MSQQRPSVRRPDKDRIPRGLWVRVLVYGLIGHLFAAFLIFLFAVGGGD
ncbi:DUF6126 family protein [Streptomyces hoynatensis]|nr:DUF6126 family protein [Streptomyces hoynatensis]